MPYKDPQIKLEKQREWQRRNKDKINAYNRARYAADPTKQKAASKRWIVSHREQYNERMRKWIKGNRARLYDPNTAEGKARLDNENKRKRALHLGLKAEVLTYYGGGELRCVWPDCEVVDLDMLTLDHIDDNGAEHRRELRNHGTGTHIYRFVKRGGFPDGFQTLCANHQFKKEAMRRQQHDSGISLVENVA